MDAVKLDSVREDQVPLLVRARGGGNAAVKRRLARLARLEHFEVGVRKEVDEDAAAAALEGRHQHLDEDGELCSSEAGEVR